MTRRLWTTVSLGAAMLSACAALQPQVTPSPASHASAASLRAPLQIAQVPSEATTPYGRAAPFVLCRSGTCPRVTPKTLAHVAALRHGEGGTSRADPLAPRQEPTEPSAQRLHDPVAKESSIRPMARLPPSPSSPDAAQDDDESLGDIALTVLFQFGSARLTEAAKTLLNATARQASEAGPLHRLRIVGRTDGVGPKAVNDGLALARARAVRDHLRSRLARWPATVDVEATGVCCYAASNNTAEGRLLNRRVEITLSAADQEAAP